MSLYYRRCIFLDHTLQCAADCNLQLRSCLLSSFVMSLHTKANFTISLFLFLFKGISAPKGLKITVIEPTPEDQMSQSHFEWENFIRPSRFSSVGLWLPLLKSMQFSSLEFLLPTRFMGRSQI